MKTLKLLQRNLLCILLCVILCAGCKTEETKPKPFELPRNDIMVIFENGYKKGALHVLEEGCYKPERWEKDSVSVVVFWQ
jgi:nitrous oxide reductase accessory protein NosL